MRVLSKCKIQVGDVIIEPNKIQVVADEVKQDRYFQLCKQSELVQVFEEEPKQEEKEPKKAKKEA